MSASIVFSGSIVAGPQGSGDCGSPSGVTNIAFGSVPAQLPSAVMAQGNKQINSASAYVTLDGIGPTANVTQGNFLYFKANADMLLRLTTASSLGPDVVSVLPVRGPLVMQFPSASYLKLLEAQGVGSVEYLVSGNL